ncbi:hypothetical protein QFC20_006654 [Naganishia adeliensis]|uniref:Uncharacterized protein n=1 Tax=Naganishia adeliensis TaxID=92952 RepID=A0ACC2V982_9TREE|nr:hypothetical protein QFC20_006654 [Naganishia adeliensis]
MPAQPIRTTVLGAGLSLSAFHYPIITSYPDLFTLHSVLERSADLTPNAETGKSYAKSAAKDRCGDSVRVVKSLEEVTGDKDVELVVIGVPNNLHFEYAKKCMEAGKHVMLEKPITTTYDESLQLIEIAKKNNVILTTYQNRRWDSDFLAVQQLLKDGKLGQLNEYNSHFDRYRPAATSSRWKEQPGASNDALYNLGSHVIDQALVLFGTPESVTGFSFSLRSGEGLDDSFVLHMHYPSSNPASTPYPLMVTCRASMIRAQDPQPRFNITGDKGSYVKFGLDPQENEMRVWKPESGRIVGDDKWGYEEESMWGELQTNQDGKLVKEKYPSPPGSYQNIYQNLYTAIREDKDALIVKPEQAALTMKIIELAFQSSREGRRLKVEV